MLFHVLFVFSLYLMVAFGIFLVESDFTSPLVVVFRALLWPYHAIRAALRKSTWVYVWDAFRKAAE